MSGRRVTVAVVRQNWRSDGRWSDGVVSGAKRSLRKWGRTWPLVSHMQSMVPRWGEGVTRGAVHCLEAPATARRGHASVVGRESRWRHPRCIPTTTARRRPYRWSEDWNSSDCSVSSRETFSRGKSRSPVWESAITWTREASRVSSRDCSDERKATGEKLMQYEMLLSKLHKQNIT